MRHHDLYRKSLRIVIKHNSAIRRLTSMTLRGCPVLDLTSAPRRSDRRVSSLTEAQIFAKYRINGNLRDNLSSDGRVAREQRRINEWLDHPERRMQSSKELHRVQRWRMHWKLACDLKEKGVPAKAQMEAVEGKWVMALADVLIALENDHMIELGNSI